MLNKFVVLITAVLVFASCKTPRTSIVEPKGETMDDSISKDVFVPKKKSADSIYELLKKSEIDFGTLVFKFSGSYEFKDDNQNFNGQVRIYKDSLIWINITALNIEVARVLISQDSVKFMNKLNKTYFVGDINFINQRLNTELDFGMLQSVMIGNDFEYYEIDKFEFSDKGDKFEMNTINRSKLKKFVKNTEDYEKVLVQKICMDTATYKIVKQEVRQLKNENRKFEAIYSGFITVEGQVLPTDLYFKVFGEKSGEINLKYNDPVFNSNPTMPFNIPAKYEPMKSN